MTIAQLLEFRLNSQFARFLISGGLATLSYLVVFNGLVLAQVMPPPIASVCAYFVGTVVSYAAHSTFTFSIPAHEVSGVVKFLVQSALGVALSYLIIEVSGRTRIISNFWASIGVAILIPLMNYFLMKYWTFRMSGGRES